jgi:hypothetical protein
VLFVNVDCHALDGAMMHPSALGIRRQHFTRSMQGKRSEEQGNLSHDLADQTRMEFRACGENGAVQVGGTSFVNNQVIREFARGQSFALGQRCDQLELSKELIVECMAQMARLRVVPLASTEESSQQDEAGGASFAATVLPVVHRCNSKLAKAVCNSVQSDPSGDAVVDFHQVKAAFESSCECMGITCNAAGGVWDGFSHRGREAAAFKIRFLSLSWGGGGSSCGKAAEPCGTGKPDKEKEGKAGLVTGVARNVGRRSASLM